MITDTGPTIPFTLDMNVPFIFGQPFTVSVSMNATGGGTGSGAYLSGGIGHAYFSNTGYWNGISQVVGNDDLLVTDFDVTSTSGIDFRQSLKQVPEPTTLLLFLVGVLFARPLTRGRT